MTIQENPIIEFTKKSGYRLHFRHALYTVQKLENLNESDKNTRLSILKGYAQESQFILRRELDFGFYRFLRKKELSRKDWFNNQMREIGYLILLDLLHPEKATPTKAKNKKHNGTSTISFTDPWLEDRQLARIRKNYPEIFFTPQKVIQKGRGNRTDKREVRYSTTFSDMSNVSKEEWVGVFELLTFEDLVKLPYHQKFREILQFNAALRIIEPTDIVLLRRFCEYLKTSIRLIINKFGQPTKNQWLVTKIEQATTVVESIYQLIDEAIALRWIVQ